MTPEAAAALIEIFWKFLVAVIAIATFVGAVKYGLRDARATAKALKEFLDRFEGHEEALRRRLEIQDQRIAAGVSRMDVMEAVQAIRNEEAKAGLARIEGSLSAMRGEMNTAMTKLHERIDDALKETR